MRPGMQFVASIRDGSKIKPWRYKGQECILEINPNFPPRLHFGDGRSVDLEPVLVPVISQLDPTGVHEHPPFIVGQEFPRDVTPPRPGRGKVDIEWRVPDNGDE